MAGLHTSGGEGEPGTVGCRSRSAAFIRRRDGRLTSNQCRWQSPARAISNQAWAGRVSGAVDSDCIFGALDALFVVCKFVEVDDFLKIVTLRPLGRY